MAADPETLTAINALSENLRNAVDARLNAHKEESDRARQEQDRARQRIYERLDVTRSEIQSLAAEVRSGAKDVSVQIATLGTELRAHIQYDELQFARHDRELGVIRETAVKLTERVDNKMDAATSDRGKLWQIVAWVVGATGIGASLLDRFGPDGR